MEFELNLLMLEQEDLPIMKKLGKDLCFAYIADDFQIILGRLPLCHNSGTSYLDYLEGIGAQICITVGYCEKDLEVINMYKDRIEHYLVRKFNPKLDPNIRLSNDDEINLQKFIILEKQYNYNTEPEKQLVK